MSTIPFQAPVARMMASPSTPARGGKHAAPKKKGQGQPMSRPRTRSNGKETQDFQAQADRMEEIQDLADPDYRGPRTTPRKRRPDSDISPTNAKRQDLAPASPDEDEAVAEEMNLDAPTAPAVHAQLYARSPTLAGNETIIKTEGPPPRTPIAAERFFTSPWDGYDDEVDKLEEAKLQAEENEALAAARRARREVIIQRRRLRELTRQHGHSRVDAIVLGPDGGGL